MQVRKSTARSCKIESWEQRAGNSTSMPRENFESSHNAQVHTVTHSEAAGRKEEIIQDWKVTHRETWWMMKQVSEVTWASEDRLEKKVSVPRRATGLTGPVQWQTKNQGQAEAWRDWLGRGLHQCQTGIHMPNLKVQTKTASILWRCQLSEMQKRNQGGSALPPFLHKMIRLLANMHLLFLHSACSWIPRN